MDLSFLSFYPFAPPLYFIHLRSVKRPSVLLSLTIRETEGEGKEQNILLELKKEELSSLLSHLRSLHSVCSLSLHSFVVFLFLSSEGISLTFCDFF